ncbi:hypothetical protein NKH77_53515 [Streptomyces sp. M19]
MNTYQLNVGGNTDFLNLADPRRAAQKTRTKRSALQAAGIDASTVSAGPNGFVEYLGDEKVCMIRIEAASVLNSNLTLDIRMQVEDSPNATGVLVNAVRIAKTATEHGHAGSVHDACAFLSRTHGSGPRNPSAPASSARTSTASPGLTADVRPAHPPRAVRASSSRSWPRYRHRAPLRTTSPDRTPAVSAALSRSTQPWRRPSARNLCGHRRDRSAGRGAGVVAGIPRRETATLGLGRISTRRDAVHVSPGAVEGVATIVRCFFGGDAAIRRRGPRSADGRWRSASPRSGWRGRLGTRTSRPDRMWGRCSS